MARVSTYLNFNGETEIAFDFYKSIFGGEFTGGVQRFGDVPPTEGQPPLSDVLKNMVVHIELPILDGHVLMGTDAPEAMGFKLIEGNNVHIMLEPDSKEEADRLFTSLSRKGIVEMPMQDMFWGAYFGSFKDQYGINWMINFSHKK